MANYRTKLRGFGVPEVICNAVKHKRPADQKSAKNVKKPRGNSDKLVKEKMAKTFAHRRHEFINQTSNIEDIKARWPALFKTSH
ncbi:hypothetical protein NFI96_032873, partial [Prochilodus magdalenae]